jgi:7-keto-8-aminopelargonate synthetase-like enzyme
MRLASCRLHSMGFYAGRLAPPKLLAGAARLRLCATAACQPPGLR